MRLAEVAGALRGLTVACSLDGVALRVVTGVSTDSRLIEPGDLYIALHGERFDGHDYVLDAFQKGAAAAIVDHPVDVHLADKSSVVLQTLDTEAALGDVARAWRRKFDIPVVAVTGSVGKTSTKEMLALALSALGPTLKTEKNENNEIGLPKTLLRLTSEHKAAVVEMGMRGKGQIAALAGIAEPTVGIVTIIGESHIELLGSREAIASAKAELFESMPSESSVSVYNKDGDFAVKLAQAARGRVITFSGKRPVDLSEQADFQLLEARRGREGWTARIKTQDGSALDLIVSSPARHDLTNALGAIAAAYGAGVSPDASIMRILEYSPGSMRMETITGRGGLTILSDCYNAAPSSMKSALDTLAESSDKSARKLAFLGDMKELGEYAQSMHAEVVEYALSKGIDELYLVGADFTSVGKKAARRFDTSEEAAHFAKTGLALSEGDTVLVKGSRGMTMERVVEALKSE